MSNITREQILIEAREWLGTPYHHCQSTKQIGCDCTGFLLGVARNVGILPPDTRIENYHRLQRNDFLIQKLSLVLVPTLELEPANVIVIKRLNLITHVAIISSEDLMIHSVDTNNIGVIESRLSFYQKYIYQIFTVPNLN